mgnify:CR=1 FL=1|jgi:hypothetical protein
MIDEGSGVDHIESAIVKLLDHRYGDGIVYEPRHQQRGLLQAAIAGGFVSDEGFVTRKGRALLARASSVNDLRG